MSVLVINAGSSSIKFRLFDMTDARLLAAGLLEGVGEARGRLTLRYAARAGEGQHTLEPLQIADHREGMQRVVGALVESHVLSGRGGLRAIGHRVVHGGQTFRDPVVIDDSVIASIRSMSALAPLHNPSNVIGIEICHALWPQVPQVAVFDTAFHQSMPPVAFHYALPYELYTEHQVRRYGFHGVSHQYVAREAAGFLGQPTTELNLITLHLGNGASATAIQGGRSVDTSMGMTPLEGLIMGTRSGDIDPAIHGYLGRVAGYSFDAVDTLINEHSGLKGICGENDMRAVHRLADTGDERARLALDMFCYRIRKYIGAYTAVLGEVHALVFTGGIGENDAWVRRAVCSGLDRLGIELDEQRNCAPGNERPVDISATAGAVRVLIVETNEELEIARQTITRLFPSSGESQRRQRLCNSPGRP